MIECWLQSSLRRVFPASPTSDASDMRMLCARNERISFQACVRNEGDSPISVRTEVSAPDDVMVCIRRVGFVQVDHLNTETDAPDLDGLGYIPGLVPDPLYPESSAEIAPETSQSFWINVHAPADVEPGVREVSVRFLDGDTVIRELALSVDVRPLVIRPRRGFPVTHWFYADALCDWYGVEPYSEDFWRIVEPYMRDVASHASGQYVPIFTPPTDGVKRPHQLLRVTTPSDGRYEFDFSDVRRWVRLARECGADYFEWTHFFWQWGCAYALRIYRDNADPESLLWPPETGATSDVYRGFLAQFLPRFREFLAEENLLDCSMFHVSDEPHGDEHLANYRKARAMLKELAPWMKVADALSDIRYGLEGLTDMPIPSIGAARDYRKAGIPAMTYFCCGPRGKYVQRLLDTPLAKIRMSGWLFYRLGALGFLHWGYNYWYKSQTQELIDPFTEQSGAAWPNWAYGDPFVVYPGPDGPLESIRWEVFAESLQDYALLQSAGVDPEDLLLADLRDYDDFPSSEDWIRSARERILSASQG